MANRSDFMRAKVPRYIKKMLAVLPDVHHRGRVRRLFMEAHADHVKFKQTRLTTLSNVNREGAEDYDEDTVAG